MAYNQYALTLYRSLSSPRLSLLCSIASTFLLHLHLLLFLLGLYAVYTVVPSNRCLSWRDQPILSSISVLLFPMFTPSLNGVHATAECLVQRKLDNTIGIWFICQASSRTVQEAKLNHHKIWSHCLQSIGARSTYWLGTSRISVTCILK